MPQSYNYFRYPSAVLEFWVKEASGEIGIYTSKIVSCPPKHIGIATEIASISVSAVKLLVIPVWVLFLLPIGDLYRYCSPKSDDVGTCGSGSDMPENCAVAADITLISLPVTNF